MPASDLHIYQIEPDRHNDSARAYLYTLDGKIQGSLDLKISELEPVGPLVMGEMGGSSEAGRMREVLRIRSQKKIDANSFLALYPASIFNREGELNHHPASGFWVQFYNFRR
jgi:hypothetical protein